MLKSCFLGLLVIFGIMLFLQSCIDTKKAVYFNNIHDTAFAAITADLQPLIQKNDVLSISISSLNPEASLIFNTPNIPTITTGSSGASSATSMGATQMTGYLVDIDGRIQFPLLGNINAAGLTKKALTDTLTNKLIDRKLLIDPIVNIRFLNFRVTVLGEVARPTVVNVANEKISILEAIGLAGDLTIFAKRNNVLLIREENGIKMVKRINLNSSGILSSQYYYLKTNDVIYVEPNNERIASVSSSRQIIPIALSALSFIAIIFTYVLRKN